MIKRILLAIMALFLVCGVEAAPRNKVAHKRNNKPTKVIKKQDTEYLVKYKKTIDYNKGSYKININSKNYIYYDDVDFNLMFDGKNYSWIFGYVEQFIIDTERVCVEAKAKFQTLSMYNLSNVQQATKTPLGFYSINLLDKPLYQYNYVVENNKHYIQLLVRENEWSDYYYVYSKDIEIYLDAISAAFVTSYYDYIRKANLKQKTIKSSNQDLKKILGN